MTEAVRLDKWLWATRFFKTRGLAQQSIRGGKVEINGQKPKPSRLVRADDQLKIGRGELVFEVLVKGLIDRRVSAEIARSLYEETPASIERRQRQASERRESKALGDSQASRPDKRQRRALERLRSRNR